MKSFGAKFRAWDRDFGWTYRTAIFVGLLFALISAPFWIFRSGKTSRNISAHSTAFSQSGSGYSADDSSSSSSSSFTSAGAQDAAHIDQRPLYPYSIIPGGAYSREELVRAVQNDPVVARHYADFEVGKTRVIQLNHSELMYVSYRIGNNVFWTKHPLLVRAGETLLTDGKTAARTRCGNRLSVTPAAPVSPNQPRPEAMDMAPKLNQPVDGMPQPEFALLLPHSTLFPTPSPLGMLQAPLNQGPVGSLPSPLPPVYWPIVGGAGTPTGPGGPGGPPVLPPPVATPEPGTIALLLTGLAAIAWFYRRKSREDSK